MTTTPPSPSTPTPCPFGYRLKRLRAEHDLTQEALAERVACSVQTIRFFESGKRRPSLEMAERLADVLLVPDAERGEFVRLARTSPVNTPQQEASPIQNPPTDAAASGPSSGPSSGPASAARLPLPATELIGRRAEFNALACLLAEQGSRLVTLAGPGGMGKTRLALHAAHELAGHFAEGAIFVSLVSILAAAELPSAIATALNAPLPGEGSPTARLDTLLAGRSLLLVLDNFEHLLKDDGDNAVALVAHIVQHVPGVQLLITSRERLRVAGEQVFELGGLAIPDTADEDVAGNDAVLLFLQRARQSSPGFALTPANRGAIAKLCVLLGGMPLGIELAAAWVRVLTPGEIVAEMARSIDFLALADRSAPPRHRSMRAVFEHSWTLLDAEERAVAARLAVFRDGFGREAAQSVARAGLAQLAALVDKSLVRTSSDSGPDDPADSPGRLRYTIHELLRQFLYMQLQARGEEQEICLRHAETFTALAERVEPHLYADKTPAWIYQLESEQGNLRAALGWAIDQGNAPMVGLRLAGALGRYWYSTGAWQEGRDWLQQAIAQPGIATDTPAYAQALTKLGELLYNLSDFASAQAYYEQVLPLWRALQDRSQEAWTLFQMGALLSTEGRIAESEAMLERCLALYRELNDPWSIATVLLQLAGVVMLNSEYARAGALLDEALPLLRRQKNQASIGVALNFLGFTHMAQGRYGAANACFHEAWSLAKQYANAPLVGWSLRCLGTSHYREGKLGEGANYLRGALEIYRQIGYRSGALIAFEALAAVEAERQRAEDAVRWLAVADGLRTATGQPRVSMEDELFARRALELSQAALGEAAWQAVWREGAALTLDEAYTLALAK